MQAMITEKVTAIAEALGEEWTATAPRTLQHKDGYGVEVLTDARLKLRDRLIFVGIYGELEDYTSRSEKRQMPTITTSIHRSSDEIANEIKTRLLPAYLEVLSQLKANKEHYDLMKWRESQMAINLQNALGAKKATRTESHVTRRYPKRNHRVMEVCATAEGWRYPREADQVSIRINGFSLKEAEELLAWIQKINSPLDDEPPAPILDRYCPHCGETHIAPDDSICHHCQKPLYTY